MTISAGLIIIQDGKILLCHPTNAKWWGTYSIPKGEMVKGETPFETAVRETKEEIGIDIPKEFIDHDWKEVISYVHPISSIVYKRCFCYRVNLPTGYLPTQLPKEQLQLSEVDVAIFLSKEEAKKRIFHRFTKILDYI